MKRYTSILLVFGLMISACFSDIDPEQVSRLIIKSNINPSYLLKPNDTITLTIQIGEEFGCVSTEQIMPDSPKFRLFQQWLNNNSTEWQSSVVSFVSCKAVLSSNRFSALIYPRFIVLSFTDSSQKSQQLTKNVDTTLFDFLISDKKNK